MTFAYIYGLESINNMLSRFEKSTSPTFKPGNFLVLQYLYFRIAIFYLFNTELCQQINQKYKCGNSVTKNAESVEDIHFGIEDFSNHCYSFTRRISKNIFLNKEFQCLTK